LIKVIPKMKLKALRKVILEEMGVQDICKVRIFAAQRDENDSEGPLSDDEEQKESGAEDDENKKQKVVLVPGEELVGEMASLETLGLKKGGRIEVEIFFTIEVQVQGKGLGYNSKLEVGPEETMDVIEERVSFFRMFKLRGFQLYAPELNRIFDMGEMTTTKFRDS